MFKNIIRTVLFCFMSVKLSQYVIGNYQFGQPSSFLLLVSGLSILFLFIKPVLTIVALPTQGVGFLAISTILTLITVTVLTTFIPYFYMKPTVLSELIIFGFVLPSKRLSTLGAHVFSSVLISVLMLFFNWVCESRKK